MIKYVITDGKGYYATQNVAGRYFQPIIEDVVPKAYEALKNALDIFREADRNREFLVNRLRMIDCEISDIEHYTEFSEGLNVYQGWLAYKLLKKRLEERRIIKDELNMLNNAEETIGCLEKAVKQIDGMNNRQYSPRVLRELFA